MDPLTAILDLIKTAGIPGAIAVLIIMRIERRLDTLTQAVLDLPSRISACQPPANSKPSA